MSTSESSAGNVRKVALVTGGRQNIGLAIVKRLIEDGFTVGVHGRDAGQIDDLVGELNGTYGRGSAIAAPFDIARADDVVAGVAKLRDQAGAGVQVLVHNATARAHGFVDEVALEDWETAIATVLGGSFHAIRACLPDMKAAGWGRIVNIGGLGGERGFPRGTVAGAAKGGLIGFSKALARELGGFGITVNVVSPGHIDTERSPALGKPGDAAQHYNSRKADAAAEIPVGRIGVPEDISSAVSFVCRDDASFVNGQVLSVNGGYHT